ncbi:hypothetical protein AXF42_Ash021269 [Apostasia shenzhenica]|uniref:Uncharacterized protein n=1 Tax=Apostasia shenzhenica TaxID=1088818 RepID=A0A2H9ZTP3_9ASPA|nr:hypothetical protein AXF42_Ash021269 [Apostasia shenzhenica]
MEAKPLQLEIRAPCKKASVQARKHGLKLIPLTSITPHNVLQFPQIILHIVDVPPDLVHDPEVGVFEANTVAQKPSLTNLPGDIIPNFASSNEEEPLVPIGEAGILDLENRTMPPLQNKGTMKTGVGLPAKNSLEDLNIPGNPSSPQLLDETINHH